MNLEYFFYRAWQFNIDHVLPLAAFVLMGLLVPRVGRLVLRLLESRLSKGEEATKARLALAGALVYVLQAVAYFALVLLALTNLGVPPVGAAIPATVVSAAVGFGAQNIIADFLAGFFFLSEKQFGVGDYVGFDGPSTPVQGTVVALTLRTTKIRTSTGEVVMVPNGSAGVITNYSQEWSRASVEIAIPVREGEELADITKRVFAVAQRALRDPEVAADVAGDLEMWPVTDIAQPTVAGQPWQVKYRVLVTVNPARQWAVGRTIRAALVSAFWDHYNSVPVTGLPEDAPTEIFPAPNEGAVHAAEAEAAATEELEAVRAGAGGAGEEGLIGDDGEEEPEPVTRWQKLSTLGGRVRASTTYLAAALIAVGLLGVLSANPENGSAGWLNPSFWQGRGGEAAVSEEADAGAEAGQESAAVDTATPPSQEPSAQATPTAQESDARAERGSRDGEDEETPEQEASAGQGGGRTGRAPEEEEGGADGAAGTTAPSATGQASQTTGAAGASGGQGAGGDSAGRTTEPTATAGQ